MLITITCIIIVNFRPFREKRSFLGTTRYASIAAHLGHELSRKDDLESMMYIILYFIRGYYCFNIKIVALVEYAKCYRWRKNEKSWWDEDVNVVRYIWRSTKRVLEDFWVNCYSYQVIFVSYLLIRIQIIRWLLLN